MCGIAGIIQRPSDAPVTPADTPIAMQQMVSLLQHRGPNETKVVGFRDREVDVWLGATRLAILDLSSGGRQPMIDRSTGCAIAFNGEIYNFRALRRDLESCGVRVQSTGDTEVLLRAYIHWGASFVRRLRGMFAFAVYDPRVPQLMLGRDHFGIKPLYYSSAFGRRFAFSSEVRSLLQVDWITRSLDPAGLVGYLSYGSVEDPHTLVSGVKAVPAGHTMTLKLDDDCLELVEPEPYWEVAIGSSNRVTREEASSRVRDALRQSVELHMASDVPLGAFLSGGIDSSSIVSLMADNARRIHTLTIGFSEANFDESHVARSVASRYGTQHHEICLTAEAFLKDLPNWIRSQDQPSADGANTWAISRACREAGIVVALSGLGGDELFGGYSTFKYTQQFRRLYEHIKWMPPQVRQQIASGLMTVAGNRSTAFRKAAECFSGDGRVTSTYLTLRRFFLSDAMKDLLEPHVNDLVLPSGLHAAVINRLRDYDRSSDTLRAVSALEVNSYLVNTLLRDADQMSMAHSVEMRVPFIDVDVVNTAMSVPGGLIRQNGQPKALLCDAMGSNLDRSWIERPKMGFVFPFDRWLGGALSGEIAAGLATLNRPPFKKNAVLSTWHRYRSGDPAVKSSHILSLYALASWMSTHGVEMPA